MLWIVNLLTSLVVATAPAFATKSGEDPCASLLRAHGGSLQEILSPKYKLVDLNARIASGKNFKIFVARDRTGEISLESRRVRPWRSPIVVMVKTLETPEKAREFATHLRNYRIFKDRGLLPGFDIFDTLEVIGNQILFRFQEGRALSTLPGDLEDLVTLTRRRIRDGYVYRLQPTQEALEGAGYKTLLHGLPGDLPTLDAWNGDRHILKIAPYNIWVTVHGQYVILDPE